jgi:hypothetical protein
MLFGARLVPIVAYALDSASVVRLIRIARPLVATTAAAAELPKKTRKQTRFALPDQGYWLVLQSDPIAGETAPGFRVGISACHE